MLSAATAREAAIESERPTTSIGGEPRAPTRVEAEPDGSDRR